MASSKNNRQSSNPLPPPAILTMGFSPAAAVATWRLAESKAFHCYTYWPVQEVTFQSEEFGSDMVFHTNHFDLSNPPQLLPQQQIAAVILVIPTIKDVARMCKKLKPVLSKSSLVLVDTSGGMAPVQRLVKSNLGSSYQVSGLISDIDAEFLSKKSQDWSILHRKFPTVSPSSSSSPLISLEPCNALLKTLLSLEDAWTKSGVTAVHLKSPAVFAEFQWQRCISVVVFELLTVVLNIPQPEGISQSLVAKPLVEGLVAELNMVAAASGVKGLPSASQMLTRGPKLARRAPRSFKDPSYSRTYYEVYSNLPTPLDFLVLLPILISDELPKGGATPYLECVYAFMNQQLQLISGDATSPLLERVGNSSSSIDPQVVAALEAREKEILSREDEFSKNSQSREQDLDRQQRQLYEQQQLLQNDRQQLNEQQEQLQLRRSQLESEQREFEQQQRRFRQQQQQQQQQQSNGSTQDRGTPDNLNERLEKLRLREEQLNERDRSFKQREQDLYQREHRLQSQHMLNGSSAAANGNGAYREATAVTAAPVSPPVLTAQAPTTPGGTVYSRFDPRAPAPENTQTPQQQALPQQLQPQVQQLPQQLQAVEGQSAYTSDPNQSYGPQDTSYSSVDSRPRASVGGVYYGGVPQSSSRSQILSPQAANAPYMNTLGYVAQQQPGYQQPAYPGFPQQPGYAQQLGYPQQPAYPPQQVPAQYRRRASRRASLGDEAELTSLNGRRRNQSIPTTQSAVFSQNFQLDSVMGSTTDRYHFVSRGRTRQRDPKLSSDEDAYHASRKYIHGGGASGNYGNLPNGAAPPVAELNPLRKSSVPRSRSSVANVKTYSTQNMVQTPAIAPGTQRNDYSGFNFENSMDSVDPLDSAQPAPVSLDPAAARPGGYGVNGFSASNNSSSMESNNASDRSETRTPPTPQGTLDPLKKQNPTDISMVPTGIDDPEKGSGKTWSKRLFRFG